MTEIKSTIEKVMERAAAMGRASREEIAAEERVKEGMRMGADYLQDKEVDFSIALKQTPAAVLVKKGLVQVFLRNIVLPRENDHQRAEKAMQGLLELGGRGGELGGLFTDVKRLLEQYQEHKKAVRRQVEDAFRQQLERAMAQQTGQKGLGMKIDPALHPKFQEEWSRVKANIDAQFNNALEQHKHLVAQRFFVSI